MHGSPLAVGPNTHSWITSCQLEIISRRLVLRLKLRASHGDRVLAAVNCNLGGHADLDANRDFLGSHRQLQCTTGQPSATLVAGRTGPAR